jgi:hypothetical protein
VERGASELAEPPERSPTRTIVLILFSMTIPSLGLILGGLEMGYGSYRFGALLILLAAVCPRLVGLFLRTVAPL